jgi:regulator of sigma E protease
MNILIEIFKIIFWFVLVLVPLVVIHEFGHYSISKLFGVKIPEFAVGFPLTKRLFYKRWKGTIWSFYPIVIGGFVRIWGDNDAIDNVSDNIKTDPKDATKQYLENRLEEILANKELQFFLEDNNLEYNKKWQKFENSGFIQDKELETEKDDLENFKRLKKQLLTLIGWELEANLEAKNTFFTKTWLQQTLIIFGGILFNFITGIFLIWFVFTFISSFNRSIPIGELNNLRKNIKISSESQNPKVSGVIKDTPADQIGLKTKDELIEFNGYKINDLKDQNEFVKLVQESKDKEILVKYKSIETGQEMAKKVTIKEKDGKTLFGIQVIYKDAKFVAKNPWIALKMAGSQFGFVFVESFKALGQIGLALLPTTKDKQALELVSGPIAISVISSEVFEKGGIGGILNVMALVSMSLGIFNMLPIPALDGGRWVILTINKILGKRNRRLEAAAISITFAAMLLLAILIAFRDIQGTISGKFNNLF